MSESLFKIVTFRLSKKQCLEDMKKLLHKVGYLAEIPGFHISETFPYCPKTPTVEFMFSNLVAKKGSYLLE